ncbi:MAG: anaerobic ribonucleoside-triphosphate reductase activating protein [Candidatus Geothermincolia bacterium]
MCRALTARPQLGLRLSDSPSRAAGSIPSIKGLLPASMLDWEGRVAAVIFLGSCNFRCPFCHNAALVLAPERVQTIPWSEVETVLREREGWLDGVVVTGGEPTADAGLPLLLEAVRALGLPVKLDTNGGYPERLRDLLAAGLVDSIAMDVKSSPARYAEAAGRPVDKGRIEASVRLIIDSGLPHEFRCTVVPGLVGEAELEIVSRWLEGAERLVLQQFRPQVTLDPSYADLKPWPEERLAEWAVNCSEVVPTITRGLASLPAG